MILSILNMLLIVRLQMDEPSARTRRFSTSGHINILEWFHNSGYEFKYYENAINCAFENGHINVLEWYHNSEYVIIWAAINGHIDVLEWFHNSQYEFVYSYIGNDKDILKWFNIHEYKN